tara:strand:+ start:2747 stop:4519 length:1773 start_codon:yes stop_codon:yes gene_type:complete
LESTTPSKYFVYFLEKQKIDTVFTVSGGSIHNVLSALDESESIKLVPCYNEQGAVFAAEGYARSTGKVGVCLVTSGPGLTNIITGINCCWVDSIPLFVLAGQVVESQKLIHLKERTRQRGVQESETEGLINSIVKSYKSIQNPNQFPKILKKLWEDAITKRCGPVVLELPVDMSYKYIDEIISKEEIAKVSDSTCIEGEVSLYPLFDSIKNAKLPIFILGNGIRNCPQAIVEDFIIFLQSKNYIYISTWGSKDIIEQQANGGKYFGSPGIFGNRKANSLLYFSDCIVSVGCSLGFTHTGYRVSNLNPESLHIIDIDSSQFCKPELIDANKYLVDAQIFMKEMMLLVNHVSGNEAFDKLKMLFKKYDLMENKSAASSKYIALIKSFNALLKNSVEQNKFIFCTDMGTSFTATHSYLNCCNGAQLFTASGHAPMGWGLPGAIGAAFGNPGKNLICLTGDGGLLMDMQELMHLSYYNLNIKLIIINNGGYSTIMNTTNRYHNRTVASSPSNGVVNPDFRKIADAYSIPFKKISDIEEITNYVKDDGPMIIEINTEPFEYIGPKLMQSPDNLNELINMFPFLEPSLIKEVVKTF